MTAVATTSAASAAWLECCAANQLFFSTPDWHRVLGAAFGARTAYLEDESGSAAAITVFRAGPFRVAYLGFPIGGLMGNARLDDSQLQRMLPALRNLHATVLRIPASAFAVPADLTCQHVNNAETAIVDLHSWSQASLSENQRRNVKKATQSGLSIEAARDERHASAIHTMYLDTLQRRHGERRYNLAYFRALVELAREHQNVRITLAMMQGKIAAFVVAARHGDTCFYLHGGMRLEYKRERPSALLLNDAIEWARSQGCRQFNFMSSPPKQESLVRFKENWGGVTRTHRTYSLPVGSSYLLMRLAERIYRVVR